MAMFGHGNSYQDKNPHKPNSCTNKHESFVAVRIVNISCVLTILTNFSQV